MTYLEKLFSFEGQVAVVIGGTGVLCGEMAAGLAKAGAHVVVAGRSEERGMARVEAIASAGGKASFAAVDAMSKESIQELCDKVVKDQGQVDAVINGAGVNSATPYFNIEEDEFDRIIKSNLGGTHYSCQVFGKQMIDSGRGGSILNIGSVTSFLPLSKVFSYAASKAAVLNLTQNVAREFATQGVRVNCLCPGFFPAEQNRKILSEDRVADIMRHTPMKRFGEPEELMGATLLLLHRTAGSFITGEAVYVDGGFTSMTI
ncbi:SDR family oxidoreductase [Aeoliella mucimassa]|uniref:Putative oxidoreductase UxuB n=1 Tax=Aeoliella mucimassa TaxID=2527972 RepID=A0A518ANM4_9BACT|nr:SDR family oxidoreductase [Aeoliella mucimassa]QDU56324.1 putative oxidoreductase UxuB [Aeoliella mucimassa]